MSLSKGEQSGRDWQNGLLGCFGDFKTCILSFCVPCYVMGKNAEALGDDCLIVGLLSCIGFPFGPTLRWRIRQEKGIKGSMVLDMAFWVCIPCCALAQEARELEAAGGGALATSGEDKSMQPQAMARA